MDAELKCVNGHDRCYLGPDEDCQYCERTPTPPEPGPVLSREDVSSALTKVHLIDDDPAICHVLDALKAHDEALRQQADKFEDAMKYATDRGIEWKNQFKEAEATVGRLREALERIACRTQTENLLWWQIEARAALDSAKKRNE